MNLESRQNIVSHSSKPILFRLTIRITVFLTLLLGALVVFYILGNQQNFLDTDIKLILIITTCVSIALFLFLFIGIIESVYYSIVLKKNYLFALIPFSILFFSSAAIAVFCISVNILSLGFPPIN